MTALLAEMKSQLESLRGRELSPADAYLVHEAWRWVQGAVQDTPGNRASVRHYAANVDRICRAPVRVLDAEQ